MFPEGLGTLRHLDAIDLSDNKIRSLSDSIGDLQVIELNLNRNQVSSLPVSLSRCAQLKVLRIEENCLALEAVTPQLLKESQISLLAVDGNLFEVKQLREADGQIRYIEYYNSRSQSSMTVQAVKISKMFTLKKAIFCFLVISLSFVIFYFDSSLKGLMLSRNSCRYNKHFNITCNHRLSEFFD